MSHPERCLVVSSQGIKYQSEKKVSGQATEKAGPLEKGSSELHAVKIQQRRGYRVKSVHWADVAEFREDPGECCCRDCITCNGCFWMSLAAIYFFVILPAGIFCIIHGVNKHNSITLGVGIGILVLFVVLVPLMSCVWKCCYQRYQDRNSQYTVRSVPAYENPQTVADTG